MRYIATGFGLWMIAGAIAASAWWLLSEPPTHPRWIGRVFTWGAFLAVGGFIAGGGVLVWKGFGL